VTVKTEGIHADLATTIVPREYALSCLSTEPRRSCLVYLQERKGVYLLGGAASLVGAVSNVVMEDPLYFAAMIVEDVGHRDWTGRFFG
jgi:hypothetical protein